MAKTGSSLGDKFDLAEERVLLTGSQAIVRLVLMQRARDVARGHNTGGYVSGYRGSPIAGLEAQFQRAGKLIADSQVVFHPGLNEDLAATAIWGTQQAELRGEGKYDGVFAVWYGKGPGVDRSGDVFRHANHAGTSPLGGVIALMGDDHTCESSTSAHQSEFAFVDAMMPVLNPAGVQELLDYGVHGFALSRYAGVWVGIKCVKDNIESTTVVDGRAERVAVVLPDDLAMPPGGLNIRLGDTALAKEARLHDHKRGAVLAYARANRLDRVVMGGGSAPRIGIISTGKSFLDTVEALDLLGVDEAGAAALGIRLYKVAMSWPLEPEGLAAFAEGLDLVIVVEEKRSLIETQVKEQLYNRPSRPTVLGKRKENGRDWLFPAKGALEPLEVAIAIGERIVERTGDSAVGDALAGLKRARGNAPKGGEVASRIPYFCAGCPHNSSTRVPEGARAYAGIGCHYMVQWMDRSTEGFTHMGGEGANWIGEAAFSKRSHVYQNLGDGTYTHSGSLAIRAAVAAGVNITYKILYNDAVAMTGGQALDGGITVGDIARQVAGEGVRRVAVVSDDPDRTAATGALPAGIAVHHRKDLDEVQEGLAREMGVTVLIYDQTCAAEKRRRRKRGLYPDPPKRVFINSEVCEGCGDCGKKSNCVAVVPLETELGRKRQIDQSACNKDFSCLEGFCPSFVTVHGGSLRKVRASGGGGLANGLIEAMRALPEPARSAIGHDRNVSIVITGVGGTGVVTISAVLGQAAFLDGKGFGSIDMTGLAQKGGAVACHVRIAPRAEDIHAIRAGLGGADVVLGCDLVVTASEKVLETVAHNRTALVLNTHEMTTGDFTRNADLELPVARIRRAIADQIGQGATFAFDAHRHAVALFGDSIASNMMMLGYAYQKGLIPVSEGALLEAIRLNGAAVQLNRDAFAVGRLLAHEPARVEALSAAGRQGADDEHAEQATPSHEEVVRRLAARLADYQDAAYARRFEERIAAIARVEERVSPGSRRLATAAAKGLHKLMAVKDEYEVARLYTNGSFKRALEAQFDGDYRISFHLAPPLLARRNPVTGVPEKQAFGAWMGVLFHLIAPLKGLRGGWLDPFGYTGERRMERALIGEYEGLLATIERELDPANLDQAVALAESALAIRGFGHVKHAAVEEVRRMQGRLLEQMRSRAPAGGEPAGAKTERAGRSQRGSAHAA
ncbi:MAG: indolepyruvate ferredoxin oxidoreductase family protein [Rhizobiales bacterium]|nr:indolepyruvate ferredoxin oxidoreductase family protein [Hyphomicrobiales bacterium]